jgi:hypothetical protein
MEDRVIIHKFRYLWRFVARLGFLPSWGVRLRYLRLKLFPEGTHGDGELGIRGRLMYIASRINYFMAFYRHR